MQYVVSLPITSFTQSIFLGGQLPSRPHLASSNTIGWSSKLGYLLGRVPEIYKPTFLPTIHGLYNLIYNGCKGRNHGVLILMNMFRGLTLGILRHSALKRSIISIQFTWSFGLFGSPVPTSDLRSRLILKAGKLVINI